MAGLLDFLTAPSQSFLGLLNGSSAQDAALNSVPGFSLRAPDDPFADLDKKQKEDLAKKAAAGVFVNGAPPVPAAGISGQMAMQPAPFGALAPVGPDAVAPAAAPAVAPTSAPAPPLASVPLPPPRPSTAPATPADDDEEEATVPAKAQPTQGQGAPSGQGDQPSLLSKVGDKINQNANLLIGLGAGFAGAPSIGTGISRALTGASAGSQLDIKQAMQQGAIGPTYRALVAAGVPPQTALAAVYNPTILKSVTDNYLGDRKGEVKTVKDEFGAEHPYVFDPYAKTLTAISPTGTGAGGAAPSSAFYAPGVTQVDQSKVGDDFLNQFSPEVQSAVHAYINGDTMPSNRTQGAMQQIKLIAQKYGNDVGTPSDDTTYVKRRQFQQQMGSTTPNSFGGQVKAFRQGLDHMSELADNIEKYGPSTGLGSTDLAHLSNAASEHTTKQADLANQINASAQTTAGEVGKLFSGQAGGGVHERELTRSRFNSTNSGPEQAGSLEATLELMQGGLNALRSHAEEIMGPGRAPQLTGEAEQKKIEHIQGVINRLRGQQSAAAAAGAAPAAVAPGKYVWTPDKGLQPQ